MQQKVAADREHRKILIKKDPHRKIRAQTKLSGKFLPKIL